MNCTFCGKSIERGTGHIFVRKDGKKLTFCSSKCDKNMLKLKRESRYIKWITKKSEKAEE